MRTLDIMVGMRHGGWRSQVDFYCRFLPAKLTSRQIFRATFPASRENRSNGFFMRHLASLFATACIFYACMTNALLMPSAGTFTSLHAYQFILLLIVSSSPDWIENTGSHDFDVEQGGANDDEEEDIDVHDEERRRRGEEKVVVVEIESRLRSGSSTTRERRTSHNNNNIVISSSSIVIHLCRNHLFAL